MTGYSSNAILHPALRTLPDADGDVRWCASEVDVRIPFSSLHRPQIGVRADSLRHLLSSLSPATSHETTFDYSPYMSPAGPDIGLIAETITPNSHAVCSTPRSYIWS